ncbi:MAG TPA: hypothetical protein VJY62_16635 [Bacteroidia bacterium]|nr:hypothetical protein [Bacteroidia bacterium]
MNKSFSPGITCAFVLFFFNFFCHHLSAQPTHITGFVDAYSHYEADKLSFSLGEQDLFITSEVSDRITFLGESVFKYSASSPTLFDVSIERVVIKYNFKGNHNLLIGKHHTPVNYWNDTYHHGRVFFPTIFRPLLFSENIIPLHTTGISISGHDFGPLKFGYDLMAGNGIGSGDLTDNDKNKSFTVAAHCKPADKLRVGASYYYDIISKGSMDHHTGQAITSQVIQQLAGGSIAYFARKAEFLSEATFAINKSDSLGTSTSFSMYAYAGYRLKEKIVPYIRFDLLDMKRDEVYFNNQNIIEYTGGIRYEINYLAVVKLEYQRIDYEFLKDTDMITAQFAIGF